MSDKVGCNRHVCLFPKRFLKLADSIDNEHNEYVLYTLLGDVAEDHAIC